MVLVLVIWNFPPLAGRATSEQCLQLGLQGSLIPVATLAVVAQRQKRPRCLPPPLVFVSISADFTAPPRIPASSSALELGSMRSNFPVEPEEFTTCLPNRLLMLYAQ